MSAVLSQTTPGRLANLRDLGGLPAAGGASVRAGRHTG